MKGETKPLSRNIDFCSECKGKDIVYDDIVYDARTGDKICRSCGVVIEEKKGVDLNQGARPEVYADFYQSPGLFGMYGSKISTRKNDQREFTPKQLSNADSLRKTEKYFSIKNKGLVVGLAILENMVKMIKTPENVKADAIKYFKQAFDKKLTLGRSYEEIIATSIFIAYKKNKKLKSIKELAEQTSVRAGKIYKCCQLFMKELKINIYITPKSVDCISKIYTELLNEKLIEEKDIEIQKKVRKIIEEFKKKVSIVGKDFSAIVGAAFYIVLKDYPQKKINGRYKAFSQEKLSSIANVSEVTLRSRYKEMMKNLPFSIIN